MAVGICGSDNELRITKRNRPRRIVKRKTELCYALTSKVKQRDCDGVVVHAVLLHVYLKRAVVHYLFAATVVHKTDIVKVLVQCGCRDVLTAVVCCHLVPACLDDYIVVDNAVCRKCFAVQRPLFEYITVQ